MLYIGLNPAEITAWEFLPEFNNYRMEQASPAKVAELLGSAGGYHSCCSRNHGPVLDLVKRRYGIDVEIPCFSCLYPLRKGDRVIIVVVANARGLEQEVRYTREELRKARIFFRLYTVS